MFTLRLLRFIPRLLLCAIALGLAACVGCSSSEQSASGPVVVTADWLNQSITVLDYARLTDSDSTAEEAIVQTIDLSDWDPGPLEVELTPDGRTAVVSVSPGFFDGMGATNTIVGSPSVAPGGTLLIVDLETGEATSVDTEDVPMGIAISPDGLLAYTANYGTTDGRGDSMSIVDIASRAVIEELNVGRGPEQVVLSADGSLGAVNLASESAVRVFQTADVAGTISDPVTVGTDPSDLAFVEGNDLLAVANSLSLTVSLIDTADPTAPVVLEEYGIGGGFPYGLTYVPSRSEILAPLSPASADAPSSFVTIAVEAQGLVPSSPETISGGAFPLTAAVDADGAFGFIAHITNHQLSIIDLDSGRVRSIAWLTQPGPSYVAVQP